MLCVLSVREGGSKRECLIHWKDHSIEWKIMADLSSFKELEVAFDVFLKETKLGMCCTPSSKARAHAIFGTWPIA